MTKRSLDPGPTYISSMESGLTSASCASIPVVFFSSFFLLLCGESIPWAFLHYHWLFLESSWHDYALRKEMPDGESYRQRLQPGPHDW